jgi:hypothetical protein
MKSQFIPNSDYHAIYHACIFINLYLLKSDKVSNQSVKQPIPITFKLSFKMVH